MSKKNRVAIYYGGAEFAVSGRTAAEVVAQIEAGVASESPTWLEARVGQGRSTPVRLLLGQGIPIAVGEVNLDGAPADRDEHPETDDQAMGRGLTPAADIP